MPHDDFWEKLLHTFACISQPHPSPHSRGSNPPDLAGSLPNFHAISRSPEFRKILPDFQNFPTLFSNKWLDRHLIQHSHCEDLSHARLCSETLFFMTSKQRSRHFVCLSCCGFCGKSWTDKIWKQRAWVWSLKNAHSEMLSKAKIYYFKELKFKIFFRGGQTLKKISLIFRSMGWNLCHTPLQWAMATIASIT